MEPTSLDITSGRFKTRESTINRRNRNTSGNSSRSCGWTLVTGHIFVRSKLESRHGNIFCVLVIIYLFRGRNINLGKRKRHWSRKLEDSQTKHPWRINNLKIFVMMAMLIVGRYVTILPSGLLKVLKWSYITWNYLIFNFRSKIWSRKWEIKISNWKFSRKERPGKIKFILLNLNWFFWTLFDRQPKI